MQKCIVGLGLGVCLSSVAAKAAAQPANTVAAEAARVDHSTQPTPGATAASKLNSIDGRWTLGLEAGLAQLYWRKAAADSYALATLANGGAGPEAVVGYGLNAHWLLAARAAVVRKSGSDLWSREWRFSANPELSYVFGAGFARPIAGVQALVQTISSSQSSDLWLGGGLHAGVQLGLAEHLSLEPRASVDYYHSHATYDIEGFSHTEQNEDALSAAASLRFCAWL